MVNPQEMFPRLNEEEAKTREKEAQEKAAKEEKEKMIRRTRMVRTTRTKQSERALPARSLGCSDLQWSAHSLLLASATPCGVIKAINSSKVV